MNAKHWKSMGNMNSGKVFSMGFFRLPPKNALCLSI